MLSSNLMHLSTDFIKLWKSRKYAENCILFITVHKFRTTV